MPRLARIASLGLTESDWLQFQRMGDLNRDGKINDEDVKILLKALNSRPGDPNWNPLADLDFDGWVGPNDILMLSDNYGKDIWTWKGLAAPTVPALLALGLMLALLLIH